MLKKLKKKHDSICLEDLNNILLVISLIIFLGSLIFVKNILILTIMLVFIYELSSHLTNNKYINFLSNFLGIILLAYLLMHFLDLSFLSFDILKVLNLVIKVLMLINYFLVIFIDIKRKKLKIVKSKKRSIKKYTFKELRSKKINEFKNNNLKVIDEYKRVNEINKTSDYYKVIKNNLDNKTNNDLEEYVWVNYLRFYKNKRYTKRNIFDKMNIVFIIIHVIILLLAIFVR